MGGRGAVRVHVGGAHGGEPVTALDDAIAKADEVLSWAVSADVAKVVLDMSRALKAVAEALEDDGPPPLGVIYGPQYCAAYGDAVRFIRAAIERRLVKP